MSDVHEERIAGRFRCYAQCPADLDGHAEVDSSGEIIEIFFRDYSAKGAPEITVTGTLADQIEKWLLLERGAQVVKATDEARAGRIASDQELYWRVG